MEKKPNPLGLQLHFFNGGKTSRGSVVNQLPWLFIFLKASGPPA